MPRPNEIPSQALYGQWVAKLAQMGFNQEQINFVCPTPKPKDDTAADYSNRFIQLAKELPKT